MIIKVISVILFDPNITFHDCTLMMIVFYLDDYQSHVSMKAPDHLPVRAAFQKTPVQVRVG